MLTNKWVQFSLSLAIALLGYLATVDWATLVPSKEGAIISIIGIAKMIITAMVPAVATTAAPSPGAPKSLEL